MTVALITARGGSKGLPRKNILPVHGIPLIGWTIKASLEATSVKHVFVSTEDEEIARISEDLGACLIDRPAHLADDHTSSDAVIAHAIAHLKISGYSFDSMCLLQPTSPLRKGSHIDEAYELFTEKKADCVLGAYEPTLSPAKAFIRDDSGILRGVLSEDAPFMRRQDLPKFVYPNGSLYWFKCNIFEQHMRIPRQNIYAYMMSAFESLDIDTKEDLLKVNQILGGNYE